MKRVFAITVILLASVLSVMAQNRITAKGTITDEKGEPLIGASVLQKGTNNGAITDIDGAWTLSVPQGAILEFSSIGFVTQELGAGTAPINIVLKEDQELLDEVVVVGYGVQRKSDITGAITSVKSEDLENRSTTNLSTSLAGKTSGVQVVQSSGKPGASGAIRVRGYSSNSGSLGPLYIVDGLQVGDINYLDPNMIENIEVLKDAASAAIYGAQAGNGVILITTKGGKKGEGQVTYDMQYSISSLASAPKMMQAQEYIDYMFEGNLISREDLLQYYDGHTNTNWVGETFEQGVTQRHAVGFSGANDRGSLYASVSWLDSDGIVKGNKDFYKRLSSQVNADYKVKDWLKIGLTNAIEYTTSNSVSEGSEYGSLLSAAIVLDPLTPAFYTEETLPFYMRANLDAGKPYLRDPEGRFFSVSPYTGNNDKHPLINRDNNISTNGSINMLGTFYGDFTPFKGFVFTSKFGYRIGNTESSSYSFPYYVNDANQYDKHELSGTIFTSIYYQWENYANYMFSLGKSNFTATAGMSFTHNASNYISGSGDELKSYEPNFRYLSYLTTEANDSVSGSKGESANISYFGRLTWNYDNRYTLQGILRADAFDSSKLSPEKRWGIFPSFSAGWNISNEPFMRNINKEILSSLRLRASWGRNGNINVLSGYPYTRSVSVGAWSYNMGPTADLSYGSAPAGLKNPDLKWETSEQLDFGVDARFLRDRLTLVADYYIKTTRDLLVAVTPPYETGATSVMMNAGSVLNRGFEAELSWRDHIGDFHYGISGNLATLHNEVTYLDPTVSRIAGGTYILNPATMFEVGHPVWYMYGYKYDGVDPATGNPRFKDINVNENGSIGDGVIDEKDKTQIGCAIPDFTYGVTLTAAWKGMDLTVFGSGVSGNDIWCCLLRNDYPKRNMLKLYYDERWTEANPTGSRPRAGATDGDKYLFSDANIFDGSYFKIKQIQLGYSFPEKLLRKAKVAGLRLYASMDDWFTFTSYPGFDPEAASSNTSTEMGLDKGSYPVAKKMVFGLKLTF